MALTPKKVYAILKKQMSDMAAKLNSPVRYKGTVASADLLPLNPEIGDMYNIESKSIYGEAGMNVAWNGVVWDTMGAPIDMSLYLKSTDVPEWSKQPFKPEYTAKEVGALPADTKIPSNTSDLTNDSGFLTEVPDTYLTKEEAKKSYQPAGDYLSGTDKTLSVSGNAADAATVGKKIDSLKEDKVDKPVEPPAVGKILKVKSVNEDGTFTCEWADTTGLDVQINGESIVKDGVAEIPRMKNGNAGKIGSFGLAAIDGGFDGIVLRSDGRIAVNEAKTNFIAGRFGIGSTPNTGFITPKYIDYIVKLAMCDGKGAAWTESEKTGAWSRQNTIKTEMDDIAVAGAQYYLGELTELTITLPDDALAGQDITIVWYNGTTAANLSIDGNILDFDYVPTANTRSELSCLWDGTYWCLLSNEQSVPTTEVTEDA